MLIILLITASLLNFLTGIIKFPEVQRFFIYIYDYISASDLSRVHDYSGLALVGLIVIHLILKREKLFGYFTRGYEIPARASKIIYILIGIALVVLAAAYVNFHFLEPRRLTRLSAVEVRDYQGEKLGSILDFRENSIKGTQRVDKNSYKLEITGLVSTPKVYSYEDILKFPSYQKVVAINCVEGWSVKVLWEGVLVKDLFKDLTIGQDAKTVIFYAMDGYSTSFPLDYILQNNIIMADKMNGQVIPSERGFPFQLVAEQKWGYKWIKWITKIELSDNVNYEGYWESRGYNNNGDLSGSKYEK